MWTGLNINDSLHLRALLSQTKQESPGDETRALVHGLTPNICRKSGSRKRKGMLETCNRLGCCFSVESECDTCWETSVCVTSSVCPRKTKKKKSCPFISAHSHRLDSQWRKKNKQMKDSKLAYLSAAIIFHFSGMRINRRWVMVAYLRSCIYDAIINLHLLLSEEPKHTRYTDKYPANTLTLRPLACCFHHYVDDPPQMKLQMRVTDVFSLSASSFEQKDTHTHSFSCAHLQQHVIRMSSLR